MLGWLIYSKKDIEKNKQYIELYVQEGKACNISIVLMTAEDMEFGVRNTAWFFSYQKREIRLPDFAICRTIYPLLNKQLEYMGIPVFNNSQVADICNDKAKTYQYVAKLGIRMVDSIFVKYSQIQDAIRSVSGPTVIKAVDGHGGSQVFLLESSDSTAIEKDIFSHSDNIKERFKGSDAVIQPLTGNRHQDLRVYIIGNQIIAAILRTAKEGFKSNYSLGGNVQSYQLSYQEEALVNRITSMFEFGLVGIDFILGDNGELIFNEIEDVVGARMLYQCTDINLVKLYLDFIKSKIRK